MVLFKEDGRQHTVFQLNTFFELAPIAIKTLPSLTYYWATETQEPETKMKQTKCSHNFVSKTKRFEEEFEWCYLTGIAWQAARATAAAQQ